MKRKIPVFYHIPKNAGTYVSNATMLAFRYYRRKYTNWSKKHIPGKDSIKCIQVLDGGYIIARFIIGDPDHQLENCNSFIKKHSSTEWDIELKNFSLNLLKSIFVFSLIIEARGFRAHEILLSFLEKEYDLHKFIILREPFSRAQSMYNYIVSNNSKHEKIHGAIKAETFEKYILSSQLEDSWIIRNLLNLNDSIVLDQSHYETTYNILKSFYVCDISNAKNIISKVIHECYGFEFSKIESEFPDSCQTNETEYKKINFENLNARVQDRFRDITKFDKKLYKTLLV